MAQKVTIHVLSDLSEKEGASSVQFALDGNTYEVDLTDDEQAELRDALAVYIGAARRIKSAPVKSAKAKTPQYEPGEVRQWAKKQKLTVPDRGRIPQEVVDKYLAATGKG